MSETSRRLDNKMRKASGKSFSPHSWSFYKRYYGTVPHSYRGASTALSTDWLRVVPSVLR
jgi:hypothetical protein